MKTIPLYDICTLSHQQQDDILISRFAPYLKTHHNLHLAHKHSFYHLVFFTHGAGMQTIDFQNIPVKPFQIYFMIPGQVHSWDFEGEADGYIINFSAAFFQSFLLKANYLDDLPFFSGIVKDAVIDIPEQLRAKVTGLFEQLVAEFGVVKPMGADLIKAIMLQLFIHISRLKTYMEQSTSPTYNYMLLRNFQKLIEKNYIQLKLPKDYAELLYITPNHLNALCVAILGMPAGEVIRNRIVLEAKRLLINRNMTIQEIADHLNFSDNSYFTKFFKKLAGLTPEEFRKKSNNHHENTNNKN